MARGWNALPPIVALWLVVTAWSLRALERGVRDGSVHGGLTRASRRLATA